MTSVDCTVTIPEQTLSDLLVTAFEGGIDDWVGIIAYEKPSSILFRDGDGPKYGYYPLNPDGAVIVSASDTTEAKFLRQRLDRTAIERGLRLMAQEYRSYFSDILEDRTDATTADVLVQLALFGEIVFG